MKKETTRPVEIKKKLVDDVVCVVADDDLNEMVDETIKAGIRDAGDGVILKYEGRLTGLTTAAAVWVTASLGIMVGLAFWTEALAATAITMAILYSKEPLVKAKIE